MAPTVGDVLFLDTNVLLTATDSSRPEHRDAMRLLNEAGGRGLHLAVSGQIFREYLGSHPPSGCKRPWHECR